MSDERKPIVWAKRGDTIECQVQNPYPAKLRAVLTTPEACAYGNELIATGRWWVVKPDTAATGGEGEQDANL